jgi:hypothetical protein
MPIYDAELNRDVEVKLNDNAECCVGIRVEKGTFCIIESRNNESSFNETTTVTVSLPRSNGVVLLLTIPEVWVKERTPYWLP